jgi:hypothetical protein
MSLRVKLHIVSFKFIFGNDLDYMDPHKDLMIVIIYKALDRAIYR